MSNDFFSLSEEFTYVICNQSSEIQQEPNSGDRKSNVESARLIKIFYYIFITIIWLNYTS